MTLVKMLERNSVEAPGKKALVYGETSIDYKELNSLVNRFANGLIKKGVKKGGRVGMMLPRVPELVITFLGAAKAGAIAAPVNFELPREKISAILRGLGPELLVTSSSLLPHAAGSLPEGSDIELITAGEGAGAAVSWDSFIEGCPDSNPGLDIRDEDTVYLNYTSGSTGNSKGAITTHSNIYWNTIASIEALGLKREDIHLCMFAPFAHPHEIFARPLCLCGTMVLVDTIYPKSIAEAISRHRVTCMMGLAPMYENLLELTEHRLYDLSSLRIPESGGMYTRTELMNRFVQKMGLSIVPVWGSTETTGIALANRPGEFMPPGSVGKPCPYYEVSIFDDDGNEAGVGEVGEMVFKGPAVVKGYFEANAGGAAFENGWYRSGDLATKDTDGYFYFVERKSGMMKVAGLKVYPAEIEKVLLDHPDVKEASVISVKDDLRGEVPKAVITIKPGRHLSSKDLLKFCRARLAHYKVPRAVEFMDELPKTSSGKINKKALQTESL